MDLLGFSSSGRADCRKQGTGAESRGDETIGDCFAGPSGQWSDLRTRAGMGEGTEAEGEANGDSGVKNQ